MKRKIFSIVFVLVFQLNGYSQQTEKLKFRSINDVGLLVGASNPSMQLQTINGVSYKTFSAGIGVGIDNYYYKTIPVFVDLRKNFFDKKEIFFYLDLGENFPWRKKDSLSWWNTGELSKGIYFDAGAGYSIKIKKFGAVVFSLGYSEKRLEENMSIYPGIDPPPMNTNRYNYTFKRATLKLGLSF